mmetsp:Transcript_58993/g.179968  ORF Transcript_58993/g.179968 Transcript_58993/m.179968 type:complete len:211 (-) Transcript_58993:722-1354(-)
MQYRTLSCHLLSGGMPRRSGMWSVAAEESAKRDLFGWPLSEKTSTSRCNRPTLTPRSALKCRACPLSEMDCMMSLSGSLHLPMIVYCSVGWLWRWIKSRNFLAPNDALRRSVLLAGSSLSRFISKAQTVMSRNQFIKVTLLSCKNQGSTSWPTCWPVRHTASRHSIASGSTSSESAPSVPSGMVRMSGVARAIDWSRSRRSSLNVTPTRC